MKSYEDFIMNTRKHGISGIRLSSVPGILEPLLLTLISLVRIEQRIMKLFPIEVLAEEVAKLILSGYEEKVIAAAKAKEMM